MPNKLLQYSISLERSYYKKFQYIVASEGRSVNKEIEQYIKDRVNEYEKENGKILNTEEN